MAITYVEVDTNQLSKDALELQADVNAASRSLEELKSELEQLNTMWKGKANAAFKIQVNKDYALMKQMLNNMTQLSDCMLNAKREYEKCENAVRSTVNSIRI